MNQSKLQLISKAWPELGPVQLALDFLSRSVQYLQNSNRGLGQNEKDTVIL